MFLINIEKKAKYLFFMLQSVEYKFSFKNQFQTWL